MSHSVLAGFAFKFLSTAVDAIIVDDKDSCS